jgi:hypothetical protein
MYSRRSSPIDQNPNVNSGNTPSAGQNPTGEQTNPQSSIPYAGPPVAPRPTAISHEGSSPFASAASRVPQGGSSERVLSRRTPTGGSDREEISPSPRREGQPLIASNPPSRAVSRTGEPMRNIDYPQGSTRVRRGLPEENPKSESTESSITPTIRFSALDGIISAEQSTELRRLVAHHALQRQKLVAASSYLSSFHTETVERSSTAESLTRRMDRVTADTIQLLLEGDNIITAINRVFDGPTTQGGPTISNLPVEGRLPYGQSYNEMYPPEQQMGDHSNPTNRVGNGSTGSHQSGNANNGIEEIETRGHEPQMTTPSPQMREMMEREFPSRRADETDSQYENRYLAHQRRINNTQQSWARSGYDAPPHLESASSANRGTGTGLNTGTSVPAKRQAPIPGRMHPDAPGLSQHRDAAYASLYKAPREVQFGVLPEQRQDDDEVDNPQYLDSHNGISAYRVSHGPPNNGLWNTEQYH